jgi:type I restriction enzyme, R subunit
MLKETIRDHEEGRINDLQKLKKVTEIMDSVLSHTDTDIPEELQDKDLAKAYYGLITESFGEKIQDKIIRTSISKDIALNIDELINRSVLDNGKPIIDWQYKTNITGRLQIEIGDFLIDEVRDKYHIDLSFDETDEIANKCIDVAKARYK